MVAHLATRNCHCHKARSLHSLGIYVDAYTCTPTYVRAHPTVPFYCYALSRIYRHGYDNVAVSQTAIHVRGMHRTRRVRWSKVVRANCFCVIPPCIASHVCPYPAFNPLALEMHGWRDLHVPRICNSTCRRRHRNGGKFARSEEGRKERSPHLAFFHNSAAKLLR